MGGRCGPSLGLGSSRIEQHEDGANAVPGSDGQELVDSVREA